MVVSKSTPVIPSDSDDSDSYTSSPAPSPSEHTVYDTKKGYVNTVSGVITGNGEHYSHWIPSAENPSLWKLEYADVHGMPLAPMALPNPASSLILIKVDGFILISILV